MPHPLSAGESSPRIVYRASYEAESFGKGMEEKVFKIFEEGKLSFIEVVPNEHLDTGQIVKDKVLVVRATPDQDRDEHWDFAFYVPKSQKWIRVDFTVGSSGWVRDQKDRNVKKYGVRVWRVAPPIVDYAYLGAERDLIKMAESLENVLLAD